LVGFPRLGSDEVGLKNNRRILQKIDIE